MEKECPSCHNRFLCGSPFPGCWCVSYSVSRETLASLRESYDDCLCPDCLSRCSDGSDHSIL